MKKIKRQIYIYIVNQDSGYSTTLRNSIEHPERYNIQIFQSGERLVDYLALHRFRRMDIHIAFVGYHFFDNNEFTLMNGIEVLESIKAINPDIEVVMLHNQDEATYGAYAKNSGAFAFVPMSNTAFLRVNNIIMAAISHKKLQHKRKEFNRAIRAFGLYSLVMVVLALVMYLTWVSGLS